jgi:hypothetical protein
MNRTGIGGSLKAAIATEHSHAETMGDVDLDDLHTYAHVSFDLEGVGEYRHAQVIRQSLHGEEDGDTWTH